MTINSRTVLNTEIDIVNALYGQAIRIGTEAAARAFSVPPERITAILEGAAGDHWEAIQYDLVQWLRAMGSYQLAIRAKVPVEHVHDVLSLAVKPAAPLVAMVTPSVTSSSVHGPSGAIA